MTKAETALTTIPAASEAQITAFAARDKEALANLTEVLSVEAHGAGLSAFDLTRIRIPGSGGLAWEIPTPTGDVDAAKSFDAIILDVRDTRVFWEGAFVGGSQQPDCSSDDAVIGVGMHGPGSASNPSGHCVGCPMAEFGSREDGPGQACKAVRQVFLLRPDGLLPSLLFLPPSSHKAFRGYIVQKLASSGLVHYGVLTRFELAKAQSKSGIAYSQIKPSLVAKMPAEEMGWIREYRDAFLPSLRATARQVVSEGDSPWDDDGEDVA